MCAITSLYIARIPGRFVMGQEPTILPTEYADNPSVAVSAANDARGLELRGNNVTLRVDNEVHLLTRYVVIRARTRMEAMDTARNLRDSMRENNQAFITYAKDHC